MTLFLKLFLAHLIGDFVVQPAAWVKDKEEKRGRSVYLYAHILVHAIALAVMLEFQRHYWMAMIAVPMAHYLIDLAKAHLNGVLKKRTLFVADQLTHIFLIAWIAWLYDPFDVIAVNLFSYPALLLATTLVLLTSVSSIVIRVLISSFKPGGSVKGGDALENAGKWIGILERLLVFAFVVLNHWEAVGFLLAAKSVFRFGDLRDAHDIKLTEYILVGTLLSFGLAILTALGYQYLIACA